jgi:hypothetical protein
VKKVHFVSAFLLTLLFAGTTFAASFIVPTDRELVRAANAIVIATAQGSYAERVDERMINTVYVFRVDEVIKGSVPLQELRVAEPGGVIGSEGVIFPGAPSYVAGERALIFLDVNKQGDFRTWSMGIGKFNFVRDAHGKRLLMRGQGDEAVFGWSASGNAHREVIRGEEKFLQFVREEACGGAGDANYAVDESTVVWQPKIKANVNGSGFHACDYSSAIGGGCGYKWQSIFDQPGGGGSVNFALVGTQTGGVDGPGGASAGMGAWNGNALSNVNLQAGSGSSQIKFDDTAGVVAGCGSAAVGCASSSVNVAPFTFDGGTFLPLTQSIVSIKAAFTANQSLFNQVVCHELGHAIGFRHSDQGTPNTGSAVMVSVANGSSPIGANLQGWDTDAVQTIYNPSPGITCTNVGVPTPQANPTAIVAGASSQLSASATGTGVTFTWFTGSPGNTSTQVGTGTPLSVSPPTTTSYWVRASGTCGTPQNSASSVTVTVQPCTAPSNAVASATQTTITAGNSTTLQLNSVNGSATLTYQWYTGTPPSGTIIPGQTNSTMTQSPSTTTTYYVKVTNSCGSTDSNPVTVTVQPGQCQAVTSANAFASPSSVLPNGTTQLSVTSNGTDLNKTYQWFTGNPPGTPLTTLQSFQANPATTTSYYVEVRNQCSGPVRSNSVTVTVAAECIPPSNAVAAATPGAIQAGQTSTLSVSAAGTGVAIQWFTGAPPNGTPIPGATSVTLPVTPPVTTTYYARVTGQCGTPSQIDSNPVTVTVSTVPTCVPASISNHPTNKSILVGTPAALQVDAGGTAPLHYQWFEGATGDTAKPRGTDSPTFTSAPLMKGTQFWVRVSGNCGQPVSSNTATVEVKAGRPRPVKH